MQYSNTDMLRYLEQLYDQAGLLDEGIYSFKHVLVTDAPHHAELYYLIGVLYNKKQDYTDAVVYLDSCLLYNPDHAMALNHKAIAALNLQHYDDAIAACDHLITLDPG